MAELEVALFIAIPSHCHLIAIPGAVPRHKRLPQEEARVRGCVRCRGHARIVGSL